MNAWDSQAVRSRFENQSIGNLTQIGGKTRLHPARVAMAFRKLVFEEGEDPNDPRTLQEARHESRHMLSQRIPFETLNWGCFTMMLSELGKQKELNDLLEYADEKLQPTWEKGGLFYPRNDRLADEDWNLLHVEPFSGNAAIGYARLNVEDGQKKIWEQPWTREVLRDRPWIDGVSLADGVDFLRGVWDQEKAALIVTLRLWQGEAKTVQVMAMNLPGGEWVAFVNGSQVSSFVCSSREGFSVDVVVQCEHETDLIIQRKDMAEVA